MHEAGKAGKREVAGRNTEYAEGSLHLSHYLIPDT